MAMEIKGRKISKSKKEEIKEMIELYVEKKEEALPNVDDLRTIAIYLREEFVSKQEEMLKKSGQLEKGRSRIAQRYYDLGLNNYNKLGANQLVYGLIAYVKEFYDETGSYPMEDGETLVEALEKKKERLIDKGSWFPVGESSEKTKERIRQEREKATQIRKEFAEGKKLSPYESRTPQWMYLDGDVFVKTTNVRGEILFGQVIGSSGFLIKNACSIEEGEKMVGKDPTRETCAVALTIEKVSKVLSINAVLENHLMKKSNLISMIENKEIRIGENDTMDAGTVIELLNKDPLFSPLEFLFIQKVQIYEKDKRKMVRYEDISKIDRKEMEFGKNALVDAGRVFMFEMLFGTAENSQFVRRRVQTITKVFTNPMNIRINKIVNTARMQVKNKLKLKAEEFFLPTDDITDDNRFIRGMNEVRLKIMANADTATKIVQQSDLVETQKDIIIENIKMIKNKELSIGDIIEMTFDDDSPLKKKYLECKAREEIKK